MFYSAEHRRYESRLKLCHKDLDPLKAWYEYINWLESQYDEDDLSSGLEGVIERCVTENFDSELYMNDKRFLEIFLKYVKRVCDPLESYMCMFEAGRFLRLADFFINWSKNCEAVSDYAQAERILDLAIQNQAKPETLITVAKQKLVNKLSKLEISKINFKNDSFKEISPIPIKSVHKSQMSLKGSKSVQSGKGLSISKAPDVISSASKLSKSSLVNVDDPLAGTHTETNRSFPIVDVLKPVSKEQPNKKGAPKLVIMEQLGSNQRFHADLKRVYVGDTEFSFEEIRYRKFVASKKREAEKKVNQQLCNEIAGLRQALATKEANDNNKLMKELETLKKQINDLIKRQNESIADTNKRPRDENDGPSQIVMMGNSSDKRIRLAAASPGKFGLRERRNGNDKDLTLVREMWNGSLSNYSGVSDDTKPVKCGRKDFSIFKDPSQINFVQKDASVNPLNFTSQDAFTIALPQDASEFRAKFASTPAPSKF